MAQEPCENHLIHIARQRCRRRVGHDGIRANGHGALDAVAAHGRRIAVILGAVLMNVPMHARGLAVVLLQAVHAHVALARTRVIREGQGQCHEGAAIVRPALEDGDFVEIRMLCLHDLLAGRILHVLREVYRVLELRDERNHAHLVLHREIRQLQELAQFVGHIVKFLHAECHSHALVAAECIHKHGHLRALDVLEEQGHVLAALQLRDAIRDLRDLELRIYFRLDAPEQAALLQRRYELAQIFIGHSVTSRLFP